MTAIPPSTSHRPGSTVLSLAWIVVLLGAIAFVTGDAAARRRHILQLTGTYGVTVDAPTVDAKSPTGYAHGVRSLVLPSRGMDGYHWMMQAQTMIARGEWRVRHADYDGGPDGRDVHWAAPFRLYLVFLAWLDHVATGQARGIAIERAAIIAGPIMLILALAAIAPWLARRFSPWAAGLFAVGAVATFPFYVDFVAGYCDHHGLVNLCALTCVLFLLDHRGDPARARWGVVASGVAGGTGLWISAATQIPVLIGLGLAAGVVGWRGRRAATSSVWTEHPELFRRWGLAGAMTGVIAYLLEYFPGPFALRLEVNHPLYALAWAAAGELLCRLARLRRSGGTAVGSRRADLVSAAVGLAALAALPAVIFFSPGAFLVADPFLWRLHHGFIAEFETMADFVRQSGYNWQSTACWLPLVGIVPAAWLALRRAPKASAGPLGPPKSPIDDRRSPGTPCGRALPAAPPAETEALLTFALIPALLAIAMAWNQVRWWGLACALLVPVLAALFRTLATTETKLRGGAALWAVGGALLLAPGAVNATQRLRHADETVPDDLQALAERDLARWLRQRAGDAPVVVAASPTTTTALMFFGGVRGIGTLYWENIAGLRRAAELYAAPDTATARTIVGRNQITHLVVVTWDGFEGIYTQLIRGLPAEDPIPPDAFVARLLTAAIPPAWLRVIPFKLPPHPALAGAKLRVYEVTPEQSAAEAVAHAADNALEMAEAEVAKKLVPVLAEFPQDLRASAARARILFQQQDAAGFAAAVEQLVAALPQAVALPLEDHLHVVTVLAMAARFERAAEELDRVMAKVTPAGLRQLSAGTLVELLDLTDAAKLAWPDATLREQALALLPPPMRRSGRSH